MAKNRLVVFADPRLGTSAPLLDAFVREARARPDIRIVAVCDCGLNPPLPAPLDRVVRISRQLARRAFNPSAGEAPLASGAGVCAIARRNGVPVIRPTNANINDPLFAEQLRRRWQPTLALSVGCLQILRRDLLGVFQMAVNYHDGLLPQYRGVLATAWSLYLGESYTGYSFHRMTPGIDAGPVLLSDTIPAPENHSASRIYRDKTRRAALDAGKALDLMAARAAGDPQGESGRYFSSRDSDRIVVIDDPSLLTAAEIQRRLRAFEVLRIKLEGAWYPVTALKDGVRKGRLSFLTSDGRVMTPSRLMFLPRWLYPIYHSLWRNRDHERWQRAT
ncbi:MAG: hypothetical protein KIT09_33305 [Bryobacteraceae bacterium]|nr:hypothetical protein [Bryobacteraceae bacterium]